MCDPASLMSSGVGAGTKVMDAMGKQKAAQMQDQANKENAQRQLMLMAQHMNTQNAFRGQGEAAWGAALDDLSAGTQIARQTQEEARLAAYLNGDTQPLMNVPKVASLDGRYWEEQPVDTGPGGKGVATYTNAPKSDKTIAAAPSSEGGFNFDTAIAGSKQGGDVFQTDLAQKLAIASRSARKQINSLARLSSYGGSYGGQGTVNPLILQHSGNAIDLWNNFRKGDMAVWNAEKQIPATQYQYKQSPLTSLSGLFSQGMSGLGQASGGGMF